MQMVTNKWILVSEPDEMDKQYLKYRKLKDGFQVSVVLYTPVQKGIYFPILSSIKYVVAEEVINNLEGKGAEMVINDIILDALSMMNDIGTVYNARTTEDAKVILEALGIHQYV